MITTIILYSLIILSILSTVFQFKKNREYKHDERGQFILAKAGSFSIVGVALAYILIAVIQSCSPSIFISNRMVLYSHYIYVCIKCLRKYNRYHLL